MTSALRQIPGCDWLRIRVHFAAFRRDLHSQVIDLVEWAELHVKFETRHSPHIPQLRKWMIKGLVSQ